jgi:hypothetical protein
LQQSGQTNRKPKSGQMMGKPNYGKVTQIGKFVKLKEKYLVQNAK